MKIYREKYEYADLYPNIDSYVLDVLDDHTDHFNFDLYNDGELTLTLIGKGWEEFEFIFGNCNSTENVIQAIKKYAKDFNPERFAAVQTDAMYDPEWMDMTEEEYHEELLENGYNFKKTFEEIAKLLPNTTGKSRVYDFS